MPTLFPSQTADGPDMGVTIDFQHVP